MFLHVWITWVVMNNTWKFHVNGTLKNEFTKKNADMFNTYFSSCKYDWWVCFNELLNSDKCVAITHTSVVHFAQVWAESRLF